MTAHPAPQRVSVVPLRGGARRIVLACACAKVGRVAAVWESDAEMLERLREDHARVAPLCRHPAPAEARP